MKPAGIVNASPATLPPPDTSVIDVDEAYADPAWFDNWPGFISNAYDGLAGTALRLSRW
jgi:hypothetical protein